MPSRFLEEGSTHFDTIDFSLDSKQIDSSQVDVGKGQKIIHEKYGEGIILEAQGNEITVQFDDDIGVKYLDIEWAPIKFQ